MAARRSGGALGRSGGTHRDRRSEAIRHDRTVVSRSGPVSPRDGPGGRVPGYQPSGSGRPARGALRGWEGPRRLTGQPDRAHREERHRVGSMRGAERASADPGARSRHVLRGIRNPGGLTGEPPDPPPDRPSGSRTPHDRSQLHANRVRFHLSATTMWHRHVHQRPRRHLRPSRDRRADPGRTMPAPTRPRSTIGSDAMSATDYRRDGAAPSTAADSTPSRSSTNTGSGAATTASSVIDFVRELDHADGGHPAHRPARPDPASAARPRRPRRGHRATVGDVGRRGRHCSRRRTGSTRPGSTSSRTASRTCPWSTRTRVKPALGLEGRRVILSFGLLGPGKGYEHAIAAMPAVVAAVPDVRYVILGATHPDLLRREGEAYRDRADRRIAELGLADHVVLVDRFVGRRELGRWLEAADVFVTPYPNLDQIVSGTMSYAMSAGRRSCRRRTPTRPSSWPAAAASSSQPGSPTRLAGRVHRSPDGSASGAPRSAPGPTPTAGGRSGRRSATPTAGCSPGSRPARLATMAVPSEHGSWPTIARARSSPMSEPAPLFPVSRVHLDELTDEIGIMQHAIGRRPRSGPRLLHRRRRPGPAGRPAARRRARLAGRGRDRRAIAALPRGRVRPGSGRFRNFRSIDGDWLDAIGSEDSHARAALALEPGRGTRRGSSVPRGAPRRSSSGRCRRPCSSTTFDRGRRHCSPAR